MLHREFRRCAVQQHESHQKYLHTPTSRFQRQALAASVTTIAGPMGEEGQELRSKQEAAQNAHVLFSTR